MADARRDFHLAQDRRRNRDDGGRCLGAVRRRACAAEGNRAGRFGVKPETRRIPGTRIPRTGWALGVTSLLMDLSSERVHSLLPVYITVGLWASMGAVGIVGGGAKGTG